MKFTGIDPSTETGYVELDESGRVITAKEIEGVGDVDPKRMSTMIYFILQQAQKGDVIAIEGFPFKSPQAIQLGGIGWGIRCGLYVKGIPYLEVSPMTLKSYIGAKTKKEGAETGKDGRKKLVKMDGKEKKAEVGRLVEKLYGFRHSSHNVVDAFVLARIAFDLHNYKNGGSLVPWYDFQAPALRRLEKK